jgi:hypothetical protein
VIIPTPTGETPQQVDVDCSPIAGWELYTVGEGENLLAIATAVDSTIVDLREANCFDVYTGVLTGDVIRVPQLPIAPIVTAIPVIPVDDEVYEGQGCDADSITIISPIALSAVEAIIPILGSADAPDFAYYEIDIRPEWSDTFSLYMASDRIVDDNLLGLLNVEIFGAGLHHLRLTVYGGDGEIVENGVCEIPIEFVTS